MFCSVTIAVGATNETDALVKTVDTIFETCNEKDVGLVIIGYSQKATKGCLDAIGSLEKKYGEKVIGLEQIRPFVGGAIRDCFDRAKTSHIMLLPGDLAISLDSVSKMIELSKENPEAVIKTSRWLEKSSFVGYPKGRLALNKLAQLFLQVLFFTKCTDMTQSVQTMPTALYRSVDWKELNFPFLEEFALVPVRLKAEIIEIPVKCFQRTEGKSNSSALQTALYLKTALRIRFSSIKKLLF